MYYVNLNKTYMLTLNICGKNIIGYHFDLATTLENQCIPCIERGKQKLSQVPSSSRLEEVVILNIL